MKGIFSLILALIFVIIIVVILYLIGEYCLASIYDGFICQFGIY